MFNWLFTQVTKVVKSVSTDVKYKSCQHWVNKKGHHYFRIELDIRSDDRITDDGSCFTNKVIVVKWTGSNVVLVPDYDPRKGDK